MVTIVDIHIRLRQNIYWVFKMKVLIDNKPFWNHIVYSFETLFRCIHISNYEFILYDKDMILDSKSILYANSCPEEFEGIFIKQGGLFSDLYLTKESIPTLPLARFNDIPVFFCEDSVPQKSMNGLNIKYNWDIIQGVFFLASGYEEVIDGLLERDEFSRPRIDNRIVFKENLLYSPVINIYAELIREDLASLEINTESYVVSPMAHISHDVDLPFEINNLRYGINKIAKIFNVKGLNYHKSKGFNYIFNVEKKLKLKSSWYFIVGGNNPFYDNSYDIYNEEIENIIERIRKQDGEVGWHYSFNAAYDKYLMKEELNIFSKRFPKHRKCGRNHFLRYNNPISWREYENYGIEYDCTLSSPYHEGFVFGICTPFKLFDTIEGKQLNVWEIPLLVMEKTLSDYRHLNAEEAINYVEKLMDITLKYEGVFSILWHNSSFFGKLWKNWDYVYERVMERISEKFESKTGIEIIDIYRINYEKGM